MDHGEGKRSVIGLGVYTVPEAARLVRASTGQVRRWACGTETVGKDGVERKTAPILHRDLKGLGREPLLSFLDLVELFYLKAFTDKGVKPRMLLACVERAREILGTSHPFATRNLVRWATDGRIVLALEKDGVTGLNDLQRHFPAIAALYLDYVEFDDEEIACRWWPLTHERAIVIDPRLSLGRPVTRDGHIPVDVIAEAYRNDPSIESIADWYEVSEDEVRDAVEYAESLRKAA